MGKNLLSYVTFNSLFFSPLGFFPPSFSFSVAWLASLANWSCPPFSPSSLLFLSPSSFLLFKKLIYLPFTSLSFTSEERGFGLASFAVSQSSWLPNSTVLFLFHFDFSCIFFYNCPFIFLTELPDVFGLFSRQEVLSSYVGYHTTPMFLSWNICGERGREF